MLKKIYKFSLFILTTIEFSNFNRYTSAQIFKTVLRNINTLGYMLSLILTITCYGQNIREQSSQPKVKPGIDNIDSYISIFKHKRVGLITNQTGVNSELQSSIDVLEKKVVLTALFAPEHGIRGNIQAGKEVVNNIDAETGLTVYSLYNSGTGRKLTAAMLANIDILAYDIQDTGSRFYTYISTMTEAMRACKKYNKTFVVFDRPNPISGDIVEGGSVQYGYYSFVGMLPIPVRYGLTCGELARYINTRLNIDCKLFVVPMKGWKRKMFWKDTGLQWIIPSPNIPAPETALAYSGTCFFEGTNVSEGRGTTKPFELIGAPWIKPLELSKKLNKLNLPGVIFTPVYFSPVTSKYKGETCGGVSIHVTDIYSYNSVETAIAMIRTIQDLYKNKFKFRSPVNKRWWIDLLTGSSIFRRSHYSYKKINAIWQREAEIFKKQSQPFYLYK